MPEGIYNFNVRGELGGKIYSENGNFSVVSVGAEAQDLVANALRMQTLATLTGGKNFDVNELSLLAETLENEESIASILREDISSRS